jgi:hypothetical protein
MSYGKTTTTSVYPQTPTPPTAGQSAAEYAAALPTILEAQRQYQPKFAEADYQAFEQLAPKYTAIYDQISKQYYPQTYGLQEQLAKQASEVASAQEIPDWMQQQYRNNVNAQLGTNVNSPIGADYVSRGLIDQAQQYRQYYQNMGLSLAGRQPLTTTQYQQPSFNVANSFAPAYNTNMQGYSSYASASRPTVFQNPSQMSQFGDLMGGIGSAAIGAAALGM